MAQGPRHLRDSFASTGVRITEQTLNAAQKAQVLANLGLDADLLSASVSTAALTVLDDATVDAMLDTLGGASATGTGGVVRATSPTLVTPVLGTPTSGDASNLTGTPVWTNTATEKYIRTAAFAITGAALHAATTLTAFTFSADAVLLRCLLDVTTVSTGAATVDVGYTAVSATTSSDTLLDGVDVNTATALFDSMDATLDLGANAKAQKAVSGKWITVTQSAETTGLVATLYVQYILA